MNLRNKQMKYRMAGVVGKAFAMNLGSKQHSKWCKVMLMASLSAALLSLGGCMAPAHIAMEIEKAGSSRDIGNGKAVLLKHIKTLQAKGDPLGDYFYALGNSDGWIKDVTDPKAITELFEKAAAKGSMDAKILLALQVATSRPVPGKLDEAKSPRGNLIAWETGLAQLLPLLQQQCYVRRLVIGDETLSTSQRPFVTTYAIAYEIWPTFRDGYYRNNADGSRTLLKDPERHQLWERLHKDCAEPSALWLDTLYR